MHNMYYGTYEASDIVLHVADHHNRFSMDNVSNCYTQELSYRLGNIYNKWAGIVPLLGFQDSLA